MRIKKRDILELQPAKIGIGSNEEKVVKRVYIFEGWREGGLDLLGKEYLEKILKTTDIGEILAEEK